MPSLDRLPPVLTACPAAAALALAAVAEQAGAGTAVFYLLLAGVPLAAVAALAAVARLVDRGHGRLEVGLAAALVVALCVGAAARSPVFPGGEAGPVLALALACGWAAVAVLAALTFGSLRR
ncbi:MAG TPA: hypothetical protein VFO88_09045 [Gaiellaceae bacterium]|nr:hypothetical protein [Gaiellaceae bacterium]